MLSDDEMLLHELGIHTIKIFTKIAEFVSQPEKKIMKITSDFKFYFAMLVWNFPRNQFLSSQNTQYCMININLGK